MNQQTSWPEHRQFKNHEGAWLFDQLHEFFERAGSGDLTPPEKELLHRLYWAGGQLPKTNTGPGQSGLVKRGMLTVTAGENWWDDTINLTMKGRRAARQLLQLNTEIPL